MKRLFVFLLLPAAALRAQAQIVEAPAREVPRIVMPGTTIGQNGASAMLVMPTTQKLEIGAPPALVMPEAHVILAPAPMIIPAARSLTESEAAAEKLPAPDELKQLAASLTPAGEGGNSGAADEDRARSLESSFDGKLAPEATNWSGVSTEFAKGPHSPDLPTVATAARSLIARLLPNLYRNVPTTSVYDRSEHPSTGHTWTREQGHVVELAPAHSDSRGEVPSSFGAPNQTRVQQKIERLMEYAHEYFHVLFDSAVRRENDYSTHDAYAAMTEGFAVSGEQLLIKRLLDMAPALGLGPRDAMDLSAIAGARSRWLDIEDNHYSEGIIPWRKAYDRGGAPAALAFLATLSPRRMAAVSRSDPAYQLALNEPKLLSGYLGRDDFSPARRGLEAFAKAARGETLTELETKEAAAAVGQAGPEGWRRLFERTLFADKRLHDPKIVVETGKWFEKKAEPPVSFEPIFALARLSPSAGAALAQFLAEAISSPRSAARLFEHPGPSEKLTAIAAGAETLPWDEAGRRAWNDGLMRRLTGAR